MTDSQAAVAPRRFRLPGPIKFWIGVLLTIPFLIVAGTFNALITGMTDGTSAESWAQTTVNVLLGAVLVAGLVFRRTRIYTLGIVLGGSLALIALFTLGLLFVLMLAKIL